MTYMTNIFIPPHGGYRKLKSYQTAEIVYDLTADFTERYIKSFKLREQMDGAARSGKHPEERLLAPEAYSLASQGRVYGAGNIAEGCQVSGTSKKSELKLISIARASLEELLLDYEDFLRQRSLPLWGKEDSRALAIRQLAYRENRSYRTYKTYMSSAEGAAHTIICLIYQSNYLLDQQLRALEKEFLEKGGFTETLFKKRLEYRRKLDAF